MTAVDDLLAYFADGGPDTPIRTTWPGGAECWEVPADDLRPLLDALEAEGGRTTCLHVPPSPGQSMCQCGHQQIEFQFARDAAARTAQEGERAHGFTEDVGDGSMCVCGIPAVDHDAVMSKRWLVARTGHIAGDQP